jgi:hypothetical protein
MPGNDVCGVGATEEGRKYQITSGFVIKNKVIVLTIS